MVLNNDVKPADDDSDDGVLANDYEVQFKRQQS